MLNRMALGIAHIVGVVAAFEKLSSMVDQDVEYDLNLMQGF